jgi:hypothetical protein
MSIDEKRWMRLNGIEKSYNSQSLLDRLEIEIVLSELQLDVYTDDFNFTSLDWNSEDLYSSFKIKIVGRAKNPAKPPLFQSLRIIAIT